jgi:hypothetical protein
MFSEQVLTVPEFNFTPGNLNKHTYRSAFLFKPSKTNLLPVNPKVRLKGT